MYVYRNLLFSNWKKISSKKCIWAQTSTSYYLSATSNNNYVGLNILHRVWFNLRQGSN